METRDPSAPGYGLPLHTDAARQDNQPQFVLRPRAGLWITPIVLCGLILSSCNIFIFLAPEQDNSEGRGYFLPFGLLGLAILAAPLWWKTTDIEALAQALHLYLPAPSEI